MPEGSTPRPTSSQSQLIADQPTRAAERNQSLVLDHLLLRDGPAVWADSNGHATTTSLARLAPSQRLLDRIHVARGFTAYQHYGAVRDLPAAANRCIQTATATDGFVARRHQRRSDHDGKTATDVGTGITASGTTATLTTNPLLDAWTAVSAGGR